MRRGTFIIILFAFLVCLTTFPLILKIGTHIPGFFSTDEPYGALWDSWRISNSFDNGLGFKHSDFIAYPFGYDLYVSAFFSFLWIGITYVLSIITTPVLTYNLQVLTNLFLSAVFTYLLVFKLTKNRFSAIFSGVIFAFCPYQFVRGWQHLGLTYNQWIPLALFAAISLREAGTLRVKILFLISLLLALSFDFSVMYFTAVTVSLLIIYTLIYKWRIKLFRNRLLFRDDWVYLKKIVVLSALAFVILMPQFFPIIKNVFKLSSSTQAQAINAYHRPFEDLFEQSAKPLSYLLPSTAHPLFGKFTEQYVGTQAYGVSFTEHTLYLGWVPLILAFVAFRRWRKGKKLRDSPQKAGAVKEEINLRDSPQRAGTVKLEINLRDSPPKAGTVPMDFYIGFFVFLAITTWLFSQPPWWNLFGFKIYLPSFFMYKILPMYRAYCRFGIVLMLAIAVLAGFGLKFVLEKRKNRTAKAGMFILLCALVLFEFWNYPPFKVIEVSKFPAAYNWLREEPAGIVIAEYPLDARDQNEFYKYYQVRHNKKMINGSIRGTYANKVIQEAIQLSDLRTAGILKWLGVRYVLVHQDRYLNTELIELKEELSKINKNHGLKLIKSFPAEQCPKEDEM
ncbi:MAG: hypothetical protein KJ926_03805, partial [Candidatus Omnitrophica bacterium]|nr:hypothetical protein [Candidatus Omnitrophota bacterium]